MPIVVVPNSLRDKINEKLDAAYLAVPEAAVDRELHYQVLLNHFYEHGVIPTFELKKNETASSL